LADGQDSAARKNTDLKVGHYNEEKNGGINLPLH
jgi:hypothetical protein